MCNVDVIVFFFQAEDGIRDLVRSRGLGDVYKRQALPYVEKILEDKKDKNIIMYCTGGIRCEKASAYYKHKGFKNVFQLEGGIIEYARRAKELNIENKFIGKNFVFDERLGERISTDIIAKCHQCGQPDDTHVNCSNDQCHILFIQCKKCAAKYDHACSKKCQDFNLTGDGSNEIWKSPFSEKRFPVPVTIVSKNTANKKPNTPKEKRHVGVLAIGRAGGRVHHRLDDADASGTRTALGDGAAGPAGLAGRASPAHRPAGHRCPPRARPGPRGDRHHRRHTVRCVRPA